MFSIASSHRFRPLLYFHRYQSTADQSSVTYVLYVFGISHISHISYIYIYIICVCVCVLLQLSGI